MEIVATCMRINCLGQEHKLHVHVVTANRTLTQVLDPESNAVFIVVKSCHLTFLLKNASFYFDCIRSK